MSEIKPPKAYRLPDRALLAGVAAGISAHFRIPLWIVRLVFVALSFWKFSGAVAYALLWLFLSQKPQDEPIGLVVAAKEGKRSSQRRVRWVRAIGWVVCFALGIGISWVIGLYDVSLIGRHSMEICCMGLGIGLVWQARDVGWPWPWRLVMCIIGVVVAWTSASLVIAPELVGKTWLDDPELNAVVTTFIIMGTTLVVFFLCCAAWLVRPIRSSAGDAALIAETKAEMAAHLHDSVLQTLAVIQKQSGDAATVAQLARSQEKELRTYLYQDRADDESFKSAMRGIVAEIEATNPVPVELVLVGEAELTVELDALLAAAREAVNNAVKHSGADHVDVYAEVTPTQAEVFVRDRGKGFSMEDVGHDRMGIRHSVIGRMERFGGKTSIRSTPGEGTEIQLTMPYGKENEG